MLCFFNLSHVVVWNCPWIWNRENRMDWVECLYWCGHFPVLLHCDSQINTIGCQFLGQDEIGVLESVWISVIHKSVLGTPIFGKVFARVEVWMCFWCICRFVYSEQNNYLRMFKDIHWFCLPLSVTALLFVCVCVFEYFKYIYVFCSIYLKNHISQHNDQHPGSCPFITSVYFQFFSEMIVKAVGFSGDAHNLHLALCFH